MPEPFKNLIHGGLVRDAAGLLSRHWPDFDHQRFEQLAAGGLEALEMKARAMQIADALQATLPADFDAAAALIEAVLAAPTGDERVPASGPQGLAGWVLWAFGEFVARRGLDQPGRALRTLHAITQRFTAEFAIRPLLVAHPDLVLATLAGWVHDPSPHVRRLVSEGSRPRLPWGLRLQRLVDDPRPTLPLLAALQDDASAYVRRSVANHLNDIAKDHPDLVADWLEQHLPGATPARRALLRHASRTLIKQGHPRVLAAWGVGQPFKGHLQFTLAPPRLRIGQALQLTLQLQSTARRAQTLAVDYVVHHVKAAGDTRPKVFKGWSVELAAQATVLLQRRHSMREVTTRRYHSGAHRVDIQLNGRVLASAGFELQPPLSGPAAPRARSPRRGKA
jgi:3-methyladenine DNA glycosylase AlkC